MGEGDVKGQVNDELSDEKTTLKEEIKQEQISDENENGTMDEEEKMDQLEILRRCRSVKQGLEALRQEQSSILHSLVATLSAIRREKDPDTRWESPSYIQIDAIITVFNISCYLKLFGFNCYRSHWSVLRIRVLVVDHE